MYIYICMDIIVRQWENELWNCCWINQGVLETVLFADNCAIIATKWPSGNMCLIQCMMNTNWNIYCKTKVTAFKENWLLWSKCSYWGQSNRTNERIKLFQMWCIVYINNQDIYYKPQNFRFIFGLFYLDLKQVLRFHYWNYMDNGGTNIPMHVWQLCFTKTVWNRNFNSRDEIG